jgi:hypothetical protein
MLVILRRSSLESQFWPHYDKGRVKQAYAFNLML